MQHSIELPASADHICCHTTTLVMLPLPSLQPCQVPSPPSLQVIQSVVSVWFCLFMVNHRFVLMPGSCSGVTVCSVSACARQGNPRLCDLAKAMPGISIGAMPSLSASVPLVLNSVRCRKPSRACAAFVTQASTCTRPCRSRHICERSSALTLLLCVSNVAASTALDSNGCEEYAVLLPTPTEHPGARPSRLPHLVLLAPGPILTHMLSAMDNQYWCLRLVHAGSHARVEPEPRFQQHRHRARFVTQVLA